MKVLDDFEKRAGLNEVAGGLIGMTAGVVTYAIATGVGETKSTVGRLEDENSSYQTTSEQTKADLADGKITPAESAVILSFNARNTVKNNHKIKEVKADASPLYENDFANTAGMAGSMATGAVVLVAATYGVRRGLQKAKQRMKQNASIHGE